MECTLVRPMAGGVCFCLVFCVELCALNGDGDRPCCFGGGVVLLFLLSVCVTSYKGHTVDALASRADEGRTSLR
jgi:hypothetical protein